MKNKSRILNFKAIIFDLDGVLYDSTNSWIKTERRIARQLNLPFPEKEVQYRLFGKSVKERMKVLFPEKQLKKVVELFFTKERENFLSGFKLFSDVKKLLNYLKRRNIKIAIATGLDKEALDTILSKDNLRKFIDIALTTDEVGKEKPHPEILLQILKKFKLKPADVIFIGDSTADIKTAKRAKIKSLIITRGAISNQKIAKKLGADYVFGNFSKFLKENKK